MAIVGGHNDSSGIGAAWVYLRRGTTWTQQGPKLVGKGAMPHNHQGISVALSADGNTAIVGGWAARVGWTTPTPGRLGSIPNRARFNPSMLVGSLSRKLSVS